MINDNDANLYKRRGSVHGCQVVKECIAFYENKYMIVKKSIYERKYHLESNDICGKCKLYVPRHDRENTSGFQGN